MASATNPMLATVMSDPNVQKAVANSMYKQATGSTAPNDPEFNEDMPDTEKAYRLGVSLEEFNVLKSWASYLRVAMIVISTLMIIVSISNISSGSSTEIEFLAFYTMLFGTLLCCYEIAIRRISALIVQNFGFLYNPKGRLIFLLFVGIMIYQISVFGKIVFGLLLMMGLVYVYVWCKHPKFPLYMRKLHHYGQAGYANGGGPTASPMHAPLSQEDV